MHRLKLDTESAQAIRPIKLVPESVRRLRRPRLQAPFIRQPAPVEPPAEGIRP